MKTLKLIYAYVELASVETDYAGGRMVPIASEGTPSLRVVSSEFIETRSGLTADGAYICIRDDYAEYRPIFGKKAVAIARAERDRLIHAQDYEAAASFRDRVLKPLEELERKREVEQARRDGWINIADVIGAWNAQKLTRAEVYERFGMNVPTDADSEALRVPQSMTVNGVTVHAGDRISVTTDGEVKVEPVETVDQPACTCGCPFYLHRYAWEKTGKAYGCDNGGCSCGEYRASTQVTLPNGNADVVTSSLRADYDSVDKLLDEYDPKWRQVDGGTTHVNALRKVVMQKDAKIKFDAETRRAQDVEIVNLRSRAEVLRTALRMLYDATSDPKTGLRNSDAAVRAKQALCRYLPDGSPAGNELCVDCTCGHPASWHTVRPMTLGRHACLVCDDGSATGCREYRPASVQVDFKRGVPVVDDVMRAWMNAAHAQGLAEAKKLSEMIIDAGHKCMVCSNAIGTRIVHVSVYGGETAVLACPNCDAVAYASSKLGTPDVPPGTTKKLKEWRPVGKFADVRRDADGSIHASVLIDKESPMPDTKKPDPHAYCRFHFVNGKLVDDLGRPFAGAVNLDVRPLDFQVDLTASVNFAPPDGARQPAAQPEPIILKPDREITSSELDRIKAEFHRTGQSVILLPPYITRVAHPENDDVRADISRRADLGDAYRRGKRVGLVFGAVVSTLMTWGGLFLLGHVRPGLLAQVFAWLAGQGR